MVDAGQSRECLKTDRVVGECSETCAHWHEASETAAVSRDDVPWRDLKEGTRHSRAFWSTRARRLARC